MLGADAGVTGPTLGTCVTPVQGVEQPGRQRPDRKSAGTLAAPAPPNPYLPRPESACSLQRKL